MKTPTVLIIMDGYGLGAAGAGNAVENADTPNLDRLFAEGAVTKLAASGLDVGLPEGQIGNSEVGHTNIGAGRVVFQDLPRISLAIEDGSFFENPAYCACMDAVRGSGAALHIMGLLSDGGVHSHDTHLWALLDMARKRGLDRVYVHAFLDGRDVPPKSGAGYVAKLAEKCAEYGAHIATVQGRFYAMDRDKRWERVQRAYDAIVRGVGEKSDDAAAAVTASYERGVTDEFVEPVICLDEGCVESGDGVIFLNFRPDRARELTRALTGKLPADCPMDVAEPVRNYVCTTQYDAELSLPTAFPPEEITNTFGEYLGAMGMTQLRVAETEKYAHVTFFFNGGEEQPAEGEDRVLVPSPRDCETYDQKPEMSAHEVAEKACEGIRSGKYDVVILNFANCDMVGHTGVYDAAVRAVEVVDECVGEVCEAVRSMGGVTLITADHGNAECMSEQDGSPNTAHTTNPVPLAIIGAAVRLREGRLADIAPTMLDLMGLSQPEEMTGRSLIR